MRQSDVGRVNKRFDTLLRQKGVRLSGIYWCPHRPDQRCARRKPGSEASQASGPGPGPPLALKHQHRRQVECDVALGQRTGGKSGILVKTGYGSQTLREKGRHRKPALRRSVILAAAARWILKTEQEGVERMTTNGPKPGFGELGQPTRAQANVELWHEEDKARELRRRGRWPKPNGPGRQAGISAAMI